MGPLTIDSQEADLAALAAACGTQDASLQPPQVLEAGPGEANSSQQPEIEAAAAANTPPAAPAPLRPAARAFVSLCCELGVEPHPEIARSLDSLPAEAFAELTPYTRPGRGTSLCAGR